MKTQISHKHGRALYTVDGEQLPGLFASTPAKFMQNFIDAGFRVFDTHPFTPHGWVGDNRYDYGETDRFIDSYLEQKSDALLILRFWMGYALTREEEHREFWWQKENPDELVLTNKGDRGLVVPQSPSFASLKFRKQAGEAIYRAVEHIESQYGNNVLMYEPGGGTWGEWFHWFAYYFGDMNDPTNLEDYSAPMRRNFSDTLGKKYGSIALLNQAHSSDYQDFNEVELPTIGERYQARNGIVRHVSEERKVIDFYEMWGDVVADTLLDWSHQAKEACRRRKLIGVYYGYLWNHHSMGQPLARSGHTAIERVYSSPDIDVIGAPFGYSFRQMGGVTSSQAVVTSAMSRGKQFLQEFDNSTHIESGWACRDHSNPENAEETGELFRRELSRVLTEGSSCIYMDLFGGMYNDAGVIRELRKTREVGDAHYLRAGQNNRQVAVVLDAKDSHYFEEPNAFYMALTIMFKQFELERMGLAFDDFILEDLDRLSPTETEQYRLWIFPSLIHVTAAHQERIKRHCLRNENTVLWNYAVGVSTAKGLSMQTMKDLTGFDCGFNETHGEIVVETLRDSAHALLRGTKQALTYGTQGDLGPDAIRHHASKRRYVTAEEGFQISPRFFIKNADEALGFLTSLGDGTLVGLGTKRMNGWNSVLSTAPLLPALILRNLATDAGCHVYTDFPGQSGQCEGYFSFYAHQSGRAQIRLPKASRVKEVYRDIELSDATDTFTYLVEENCAYLFMLT